MKPTHILLIGELADATSTLNTLAVAANVQAHQVADIESAMKTLADKNIAMAFFDGSLPLADFFTQMNANKMTVPTVVIGPATPIQNAVKAIRLGAIEYISTPVDLELTSSLIDKIKPTDNTDGPIAADPATIALLDDAKRFAASNATILLRGESGTGKEVFSKFIHTNSGRRNEDFISLNCAAIPETLLESELFGHEKGAFSGAIAARAGKFKQADNGTLLLDEISEMDVSLQAKLLRAIQERVIDPVGSSKPVSIDIRLIATTNRDLEKEVEKGNFREDLYFRLNVVMLDIPALRERPADILPLADHFATMYAEQNGVPTPVVIAPDAQEKLNTCYWKGNVRELENTIHRAILMMGSSPEMRAEHIVISPMSQNMASNVNAPQAALQQQAPKPKPVPMAGAAAGAYAAASGGFKDGGIASNTAAAAAMVGRTVQSVEKDLILSTLDYCKGNRTHAADILGISIRTLRNKLKEYNSSTDTAAASAG